NYKLRVDGVLIADGDPANHITFTSNQATPAPGDWNQVLFYGPDGGTVLNYCDISYGGSSEGGVCHRSGGSLSITNCTIMHSATSGVYAWTASPTVSDCTISDNVGHGIQCLDTTSDPMVTDCTIQDNGGWAVVTFGGNVKDYTGAMTITGNNPDAILVGADNTVTGTWPNHGVPYVINGNQSVGNGATLTIEPGCEVRFNGNYELRVDGVLIAAGDPSNRITFTSNQPTPAPGDWNQLYFVGPDAGTVLDYCDISYGGSSFGAVYHRSGGSLAITNSTIMHSGTAGAYLQDASPTLSSCTVEQNTVAGIHYLGTAAPTLSGCTLQSNQFGVRGEGGICHFADTNEIINNTSYGFYLTGACTATFGDTLTEWNDIYGNGTYDFYNGTNDIYAYYVYWGTTDPSVISSHIWDDFDDTALGVVYFSHWLDDTHENEQSLTTPVITSISAAAADTVHIAWNPVPGALSYRVNSSVMPWASYTMDGTGTFADTTWSAPLNGDIRFYRVNAVAGSEVSAPSNIVGYEQYVADIP
ncbi:right-handed parallel beta-helix repeat-containing protein, partial [Candidatus Fermentibacteria bacterium]|nr:right-handed parallel beta-helix repeat-containing protein [Candidatus Fermentibacteria bacterium]